MKKFLIALGSLSALSLAPLAASHAQPVTHARPIIVDYPTGWHWVNTLLQGGSIVELEDGSQWSVASSDVYESRFWRPGEALILTLDHFYFNQPSFYLTNASTGAYVRAELYNGPLVNGQYSHYVTRVDVINSQILLELDNGHVWEIPNTAEAINGWAIGDSVILGVYDSTRVTFYQTFLFNVRTLTYIPATQAY